MIGRTLGNYRIVEQIGMGGMATVYKAYDPDTDRYVAIKILPKHFSQDPTFRERFQREAKAIAKLEHIHILPLFTYGEEDGIAYMAMRYLQAGTLTDRIKQGPLPLDEANRLLGQIAGALDHAHAHGVLHRDVKPSNVLLDADGNAYLTDFGIAKMVEVTLDLTGAGILGTPAYMSPEQCRGGKDLTPASDIYSLGIVLYEMVTGRTPFQAETPIAVIHMQLTDPLPPPRRLRPDLSEAAERVILKALAKEPEHRYSSCGAMAAAFAQDAPPVPTSPHIETATIPHIATLEGDEIEPCQWNDPGPGFCIYSLQGGKPTKILTDTDLILFQWVQPSWSPDGEQITFCAAKSVEDQVHVYIVNADGSDLTQLSSDCFPAWSPDGEWLAVNRGGEVVVMRPDGSDSKLIYTDKEDERCGFRPEWSPDSRWIVVSIQSCVWAFPMTRQVWIISRDGETIIPVATFIEEDDPCPEVAFSPDGKQVTYRDDKCNLWLANADGTGDPVPLDEFPIWWTSAVHPQWGGLGRERIEGEASSKTQTQGMLCLNGQRICIRNGYSTDLSPPNIGLRMDIRNHRAGG